MTDIDQILKLLPEHTSKSNTLKYIECLRPAIKYINDLLNESQGMCNIDKATGEYLDYIGFKNNVERGNMSDIEYRSFLKVARFKTLNAPTTENLIKLTKSLTGYTPTEIEFYPNNEVASQRFKFVIPYTDDITKFPDYNEIIDAGARMYTQLVNIAHRKRYMPIWIAGVHQISRDLELYEISARRVQILSEMAKFELGLDSLRKWKEEYKLSIGGTYNAKINTSN